MNPLERDIYRRLELLVDQVDLLLGDDLVDRQLRHDRLASRARQYAGQLVGDAAKLAAQTAIDLGPLVDLDDPDDAASPLGVACALTFEQLAVSQAAAAQLLGVSRARVHALLAEGKLDRVDGNQVTRASIARRLATRNGGGGM